MLHKKNKSQSESRSTRKSKNYLIDYFSNIGDVSDRCGGLSLYITGDGKSNQSINT